MTGIDEVVLGDCREIMKTLPDNYFHAIITDPPYNLNFMGKAWDGTGIAYNNDMWAGCLRVLKPGGHLLAFGGTRTYHRMACAIEDAGFEIRDSIHWVYGSGFPKSLSIGRAIDKMEGNSVGSTYLPDPDNKIYGSGKCKAAGVDRTPGAILSDPAISDAAKQWAGYGTALKPAHEPIVLARKPLSESTIAGNVLKWGCGGLNIDGCRIGFANQDDSRIGKGYSHNAKAGLENGTKDNSGGNEIELYKPTGRFPANLIWSHSPNCKRIGTKKVKGGNDPRGKDGTLYQGGQFKDGGGFKQGYKSDHTGYADESGMETVESWDCAPDCPSWEFAKAGERKSGGADRIAGKSNTSPSGWKSTNRTEFKRDPDTGSAARFFKSCQFTEEDIPAFMYYAKASPSERDGSTHPTMKPLSLMRYLCRLICPPGGLVLDPFAGSGTTCLAAKLEGFGYVGIEKEVEYVEIARRRVAVVPARFDRWSTP